MTDQSLTVSDVLARAQQAVVAEFPSPVWVRGEITGFRRTSGGAAFFRLADPEVDDAALEVAARGRVMADIDRVLRDTGVGRLRDGVEIRLKGTVGVAARGSALRLSLLEIDPVFTAGRLAIERAELIRKMRADGSIDANRAHPLPLVPLRIGLVTSRGSAAHGDFIDQLHRARYRFSVKTVHTTVQGDTAPERVAAGLARLSQSRVEIIALIRGGGSKLDLAVFDTETVAKAVSRVPVPVITGIGHEMDRTVADEAAAVAEKTPSAAGEWIVTRVKDFADRLERARAHIRTESRTALARHQNDVRRAASDIAGGALTLRRQRDQLARLREDIATTSRRAIADERTALVSLEKWFSAIDLDSTLRRGFAIVTAEDQTLVKSVGEVSPGDRLSIRLADGTVRVEVTET